VNTSGKVLRIIAIIFMGLTAAMNLLGGAGTSCAAFSNNVGYRLAFREILDYRWIYQGLVITTVIIGLVGIWATIKLVRGGPSVYRNAIIVLVIGSILGAIQYVASLTLRGAATPANVKFYINAITLIYFLILGVPSIRGKVDFSSPGNDKAEKAAAAGMAAIVAGIVILTVFTWAGPSHTFNGENWTYVFYTPLMVSGTLLIIGGMASFLWSAKEMFPQEVVQPNLVLSDSK
jgi:hypothetical protein